MPIYDRRENAVSKTDHKSIESPGAGEAYRIELNQAS